MAPKQPHPRSIGRKRLSATTLKTVAYPLYNARLWVWISRLLTMFSVKKKTQNNIRSTETMQTQTVGHRLRDKLDAILRNLGIAHIQYTRLVLYSMLRLAWLTLLTGWEAINKGELTNLHPNNFPIMSNHTQSEWGRAGGPFLTYPNILKLWSTKKMGPICHTTLSRSLERSYIWLMFSIPISILGKVRMVERLMKEFNFFGKESDRY